MVTRTVPYDVAESLKTPEEMSAHLEACIEIADGDAAFIARCKGGSCTTDKALSGKRSPSLDTVLKVVAALGLELHAPPSAAANA